MAKTQRSEPSKSNMPPDHVGVLFSALILFFIGWGGLYSLVTTQMPRLGGSLWMFFVLLQIAVTSTVIPFVRYLNVRFTPVDRELPPGGVIVRQSVWVGLFVVICAWLQIPRALNISTALLLIIVFIVIEAFLRYRERADE